MKLNPPLSPKAVNERDDFLIYNERTKNIVQSELGVIRAIRASTVLNGQRGGDNYRFIAKDKVTIK